MAFCSWYFLKDGKCRDQVMRYVADDLLGLQILLQNMEVIHMNKHIYFYNNMCIHIYSW